MYNSLILPHINYGILVWGHQAHCIFKLQKRDRDTTHVEEIICLFPEPHMNLQQSTLDTI